MISETVVVAVPKKGAKKSSAESSSAKATVRKASKKATSKAKELTEGRGSLIAAAVGVAAAAAAGIAAFKTISGQDRKVFHLMPHDRGWQVTEADSSRPRFVKEKKREARDKARDVARKNEPSQLVIHRTDGTVQTVHTYGE